MNTNEALITKFYSAFQQRDAAAMGACYHDEAQFKDEAFDLKSGAEVRAMWTMLCKNGKDLEVTFKDVAANAQSGSAYWEATYTFSQTQRCVHNIIEARFEFKDGLIYRHRDTFNFWRWSRQALGISGLLLGWSGFLRKKVREGAMGNLRKFMKNATA